MEKHTVIAPFL